MKHQWERFDIFLKRCRVCGWGWKVDQDNDFPCPGAKVTEVPGSRKKQ